jgi:hypothetical protein
VLCFLYSTGSILNYYLDELQLQRVKTAKENKRIKEFVCTLEPSVPGQYINETDRKFPGTYIFYERLLYQTNSHLNGSLLLHMEY